MAAKARTSVVILSMLAGTLIAISYRYWFIVPVLQHVTVGEWRFVAIVAAVAIGAAFSRLGLSLRVMMLVSVVGLLAGGTSVAWAVPNDVPVSIRSAFESQLQAYWHETAILAAAIIAGAILAHLFGKHDVT